MSSPPMRLRADCATCFPFAGLLLHVWPGAASQRRHHCQRLMFGEDTQAITVMRRYHGDAATRRGAASVLSCMLPDWSVRHFL